MTKQEYASRAIAFNGTAMPHGLNGKKAIYRTRNITGDVSHIHAPIRADYINWTGKVLVGDMFTNQYIGRIFDYVIVN